MARIAFAKVFTSPLKRAARTCDLAGFGAEAEVRALRPNMAGIVDTGIHGIICTAPGTGCA